ncbi:MAG: flagellar motor protein MotB [Gallionellaceae bacterium]|jgi:outer membrane protein OmpA-like peptidoglycan-associated protein
MINKYLILGRRNKDEGEKPFWISFADLMSALMVMFLLVMSVALLAVTNDISEADRNKAKREQEIEQLLLKIEKAAENHPGIVVDKNRGVIDFGERARFETGSSLLSVDQAQYLSQFTAEILGIAQEDIGKRWLKRIVAEGFADQRGDYLLNLNLSLQRSQRVLCVLLSPAHHQAIKLSPAEQEQVRDLFLVGGYSFNSAKKTLEESRRIELRLEFFGLDELHPALNEIPRGNFGSCRI